jgi:hypothetical protein
MIHKVALLGLVVFGSVACKDETVDSEDIRTTGMWAHFDVLATGNAKATATGQLRVGGDSGTLVVLTGQDKLVCSAADATKALAKDGDYYKATFNGDAGDTEFVFAFNRGDEDEAAPSSVVKLPDPFTITGPAATEQVSRAASVTLTWETSTTKDPTTWKLDGACLFETKGTVPDDGTLTLAGSDYNTTPSADNAATDPNDDSENCTVTLCIEKKRRGTLDAAFTKEGGEIYAIQHRCTKFVSIP